MLSGADKQLILVSIKPASGRKGVSTKCASFESPTSSAENVFASSHWRCRLPKILVTGGTGYIAGFLIRRLVADGWSVHTTVSSLAREAQVRSTLDVPETSLRFFAADLTNDAGWNEAVAGCSHVAHLALPFPSTVVCDENELIVPAREGALRVTLPPSFIQF
jgi:hypothetical protein